MLLKQTLKKNELFLKLVSFIFWGVIRFLQHIRQTLSKGRFLISIYSILLYTRIYTQIIRLKSAKLLGFLCG